MPTGSRELAVFGYVGRGASNAMRGRLADFTELLGQKLGMELAVFEAASYADLATAIVSGFVDVAWLPPIPFIRLHRRDAVVPLVAHQRAGQTHFHSAVIVRDDSPFETLSDLRGGRPAWVDTLDSASGYVMPRLGLAEGGLDPRTAFAPQRLWIARGGRPRRPVGSLGLRRDLRRRSTSRARCRAAPGSTSPTRRAGPPNRALARFGVIPGDTTAARATAGPAARPDRLRSALVARKKKPRALVQRLFGVDAFSVWEPSGHEELRRIAQDALLRGIIEEVETT